MKHGVKVIGLLMAAMLLLAGCSIENIAYAMTINGEQVPLAEYKYIFESSKSMIAQEISSDGNVDWETATYEGKSAKEAVHDEAVDQLTQLYVGAQLAEEAGITADNQSNQYVSNVRNQLIQNAGSEDIYKAYLKEIGTTDDAVKSIYEKSYLMNMLLNKYMEEDPEYQPSEEELKTYFFDNYVKAKHILFTTIDDAGQPLDDATVAQKEQSAKDTLAQLQNGADFDTLMNERTEDPGLATNPDGYIFGKNMMDPAFETAAYALNPGEISDIVEGSYGYHILKRLELTDADYEEFQAEEIQSGVTGANYIQNDLLYGKFEKMLEEATASMTVERNEKELAKLSFDTESSN